MLGTGEGGGECCGKAIGEFKMICLLLCFDYLLQLLNKYMYFKLFFNSVQQKAFWRLLVI